MWMESPEMQIVFRHGLVERGCVGDGACRIGGVVRVSGVALMLPLNVSLYRCSRGERQGDLVVDDTPPKLQARNLVQLNAQGRFPPRRRRTFERTGQGCPKQAITPGVSSLAVRQQVGRLAAGVAAQH